MDPQNQRPAQEGQDAEQEPSEPKPSGFDWSQVPDDAWNALPEGIADRLPSIPSVGAIIRRHGDARAKGTIDAWKRDNANQVYTQQRRTRRQSLRQAIRDDPPAALEQIDNELEEEERAETESAQRAKVQSEIAPQIEWGVVERAANAGAVELQTQMNAMGLSQQQQSEVWGEVAKVKINSIEDVARAVTVGTSTAVQKSQNKQVEDRSQAAAEQAARSARARINGAADVDPSPGARAGGSAWDNFNKQANEASDEEFMSKYWPLIKAGKIPGIPAGRR